MTDVPASPVRQRPARPWRGFVILIAATLLALAIAIITGVGALSRQGDGTTELLVGSWDTGKIVAAAWMGSVVAFFVLVCAIPAPRWWLVLFLPLRFLAFCAIIPAGILVALFSETSVVPLIANGCATGYVVRESTPWQHTTVDVLRTDGLLATQVDRGSRRGDEHPFAAGDYRVERDGDTYRVEAVPAGGPTFDLPVIVEPTHESCGLQAGGERRPSSAGTPSPTRSPFSATADEGPAPSPAADARAEVARMVQRTLDAAGSTVTSAEGAPVAAPLPSDLSCDGATAYDLVIRTDDNATSYAAILAAWDAEGYAKDRAMQEDLRYNSVVRLSARDRSSIDGLLHFSLTAECRVP